MKKVQDIREILDFTFMGRCPHEKSSILESTVP